MRYILSTDIPPKELSERLQENLPRKRCHSNRSTRYLHIFAANLLGSHYQIWKVSRKYLKKFKVKHFEVIYIPQTRKGLSKLVECYASNKKYACEKYSPISCNIMWEREGTIFDIYDNYNNMKNKHLWKQGRAYTKIIILLLGSMLMGYYFYVNLKIKQRLIYAGFFLLRSTLYYAFIFWEL